jgi:hypothetical protein
MSAVFALKGRNISAQGKSSAALGNELSCADPP